MIKVNDTLNIEITDITNLGSGIGTYENKKIYVPKAIKGDYIKLKITNIKSKYITGEIKQILKESTSRTPSNCPFYNTCGACHFRTISYEEENKIKYDYLKKIFNNYQLSPMITCNNDNYRNKVTFHVKESKIGYYQDNTHTLIEIDNCRLLHPNINTILPYLQKLDLTNVKEIMLRTSTYYNETMIKFTGQIKNIETLKQLQNVKSIYLNNTLLYGNKYIKERINNLDYTIYPNSFFQINSNMVKALYDKVKEYAQYGNNLLDLYCGTGTIGIYLKDNYKKILGIDIVKDNIENANINKKINNANNITFICKDAKYVTNNNFDTIVVDPPRIGMSKEVITYINRIKPDKIIYVSCNPNTLKRDLNLLKDIYTLKEITPINMFPRTNHVECVSLLQKKTP